MKQKGGSQAGSEHPPGRMAGGKGQMAWRARWRLFQFSLEKLPFGTRPNSGRLCCPVLVSAIGMLLPLIAML